MGPKQGPGICQGFNDHTFEVCVNTNIFVDDIHVDSTTLEEHISDLKGLFETGRKAGSSGGSLSASGSSRGWP